MSFKYNCFGLKIKSEIEFSELMEDTSDKTSDIFIRYASFKDQLDDAIEKGVTFEIANRVLLLRIDGVARFLVENGSDIIVDRDCEDCEEDIKLFVLGTCMGAILQQRNILALHASAFTYEGNAVIICGNSGVGKSSTVNAFRLEGSKVLTDDICPICIEGNEIFAISGYPQSKMWTDSLDKLEIEKTNLKTIRRGLDKRKLPIRNDFYEGRLPVRKIYFLARYGGGEITLNPLEKAAKLNCILKMTFRKYLLKSLGVQVGHFKNSSELANRLEICKILRPHECSIFDLKNAILKDLKEDRQ